jgi:hypothetical protein
MKDSRLKHFRQAMFHRRSEDLSFSLAVCGCVACVVIVGVALAVFVGIGDAVLPAERRQCEDLAPLLVFVSCSGSNGEIIL